MPSERQLIRLAHRTMMTFARAVDAKSMKELHEYGSERWQDQMDVPKLDQTFKGFIDQDIDLMLLKDLRPIFDGEPKINEEGSLWIEGHYATRPSRVDFKQGFSYEGIGWKLIALSVHLVPSDKP